MAITTREGNLPHIKWVDLKDNGVLVECAIMKEDNFGNIYFLQVNTMDDIDKSRIAKILMNRNAQSFPLWDLMSQITLNNGLNALDYFHQSVRVITPEGIIMNPKAGQVGTGQIDVNNKEQLSAMALNADVTSVPAEKPAKTTPAKTTPAKTTKK